MAQITIFKDADVTIAVIDGPPPIDQTAVVSSLTDQVAELTATLAARTAERDALSAKIAAAVADLG